LLADDIWATPDLLARHLAMHRDHPEESAAVLGKVLQSPELPPTVMHRHWDPFRYYLFNGRTEVEPYRFLACNISCKREFLVEHGLFRERRAAAHEDIELGYRLGRKGLRIFYAENALAYHYHEETLELACRRAYERGLNFDILSDNIPGSLIYPAYRLFVPQAGLKALVRLLFREIPRAALFNRWTVPWIWTPLLKGAERNALAARFARLSTYRGVVGHYFRKGFFESGRRLEEKKGVST
jgi:GT2 family glycosyltransferase